jgi:hypothetical protein
MKAKVVRLSEIGSDSTQIRSYIVNAYNTWAIRPEYLLFVGNKYQIPFPRYMHPYSIMSFSDNYYANVTGDFHNELYHGRLWVSDTVQAKTVVAKILDYETNPYMTDSLWFRKGVTIVDEYEQGQPPSDSLYWEDARYAIQFMLDAGYVHIDSFSYYLGNDSADVINAINDGRTYILYRGIGGPDWLWPFQGIYAAQMTNGYKMPVVLSGTCATIEGIGRDWLVAGTPNQPEGVAGFYGTTTSLFAAAEMRSALCRGTTASLFGDSTSNLGKAAEAGRLEYYAQFQDLVDYHSWSLLGDPEMAMWTSTPKGLLVGHNMYLSTGICTATVYVVQNSTPVPGALVCVMAKYDSSFYHYGYTNSAGTIQFIDTLHVPSDSVYFTVTGRNLRTYHNARPVYYSSGPYVSLYSFRLSDSLGGNHDGIANPAEYIEIPFSLMNWGNDTASGITATIEKVLSDTLYTLYDTVKYIGNIAPLESVCVGPDGFNVMIDSGCPDLHTIDLRLRISDSGTSTWLSGFNFTIHAPIILYNDYWFAGDMKYIPAGDTNGLFVELTNTGSYQANNVIGILSCSDSLVTIIDSVASFGTICSDSPASNQSDPFIITTDPNTASCHVAELTLRIISGPYSINRDFTIYIGQKDYLIWDPDPNHSSGPTIHALLGQLNFLGEYSEAFPLEYLHIYKAFFTCLGMNPNKYIIYDSSIVVPEIVQFLDAGGKMYLEGGDVWYLDPSVGGHSFAPNFCILPVWNSTGPCVGVSGTTGTFAQGMHFSYGGENSSIDRIDQTGTGVLIFSNTLNGYGCGVAANNQTVGLSFELGGLSDSIAPSTKAVLVDSIMGYFGVPPTGITRTQEPTPSATISLTCNPNPFRQITHIRYLILDTGYTEHESQNSNFEMRNPLIRIYDASGRLVKSFDPESCILNRESVFSWDGRDNLGRRVAQGVYFMRLSVKDAQITTKTILLH